MGVVTEKKLSWNQRVALVRHNLHAASRSGDFGFFKALQASAFIEGSDYVGTLQATLTHDADTIQATLDSLNSGIAYVHQDAFKNVYDSAKRTAIEASATPLERRASLRVDALQQKSLADNAIDRMTNSAISLISSQPAYAQETVANVWISGNTIVADVMEICLQNIAVAQTCGEDFIKLEDASAAVTHAVDSGISALKGIFSLLEPENPADATPSPSRTKSISMDWGAKNMLRRLSTALGPGASAPYSPARNGSIVISHSPLSRVHELRASCSAAVPQSLPSNGSHFSKLNRTLSVIPATPVADEDVDPLDNSAATPAQEYKPMKKSLLAPPPHQPEVDKSGFFSHVTDALFDIDNKSKPSIKVKDVEMPNGMPKDMDDGSSTYSSSHSLTDLSEEHLQDKALLDPRDSYVTPQMCKDTYSRSMYRRLSAAIATQSPAAPQVAAV